MNTIQTNFKAKLVAYPELEDKETKERRKIDTFTVGKKYRVYSVFDSGKDFTDFLVADDSGMFRWINMTVFRSK